MSAYNVGDLGLIPGLGKSPGEGNGNPLKKSHGWRSLVGYSAWGRKESDMTERLHFTVKDFGIVNKAEIDASLELCCFFNDPVDVGNLISGSSAFSKTSLNIWKFTVPVLLKPGLEIVEHYFTSV